MKKKKATILLSKKQAQAIAEALGEKAPEKPNQRIKVGEIVLWHMPVFFRKKSGCDKGKCFNLNSENANDLRPFLKVADENGRRAVLSYS